jgi:hypothetical protein
VLTAARPSPSPHRRRPIAVAPSPSPSPSPRALAHAHLPPCDSKAFRSQAALDVSAETPSVRLLPWPSVRLPRARVHLRTPCARMHIWPWAGDRRAHNVSAETPSVK